MIFSRPFLRASVFLLVQQLIVASSSIWITKFISHISAGEEALVWLWLFLASLMLPYVPGALALIEVTKARALASVDYAQKFARLYPGRIVDWTDHDQSQAKLSILSGESQSTLNAYIDYLYNLFSTSLNVILNLTMISILIDPWLCVAYVAGVSGAFLILHLQKKAKKRLALKAQQSRIRWTGLLLKAWDNILLNNAYNLGLWKAKASERGRRLVGKAVELEKFEQYISLLMAFALNGPAILLIGYLAANHIHDVAYLAMLTVILPRLFQIMNFSYELLYMVSNFPMQQAHLRTVLSIVDPVQPHEDEAELKKRINWGEIEALQKEVHKLPNSIEPKMLLQSLPARGRITLHGENGSGKTSLLLSLKMKHGDQAVYLPSKHDLFFKTGKQRASTGQLSRRILKELKENSIVPVVLLDEWDANLDMRNRSEISTLIDEWALHICVVETLHHREGR